MFADPDTWTGKQKSDQNGWLLSHEWAISKWQTVFCSSGQATEQTTDQEATKANDKISIDLTSNKPSSQGDGKGGTDKMP